MSGTNTGTIAIMLPTVAPGIGGFTPTSYSRDGQTARPGVALTDVSSEQHRRKLALASNAIKRGAIDCNIPITLTANANETLVFDARVSTWTAPHIVPVSATAKAESLSPNFWTEVVTSQGPIASPPSPNPTYSFTYIRIHHNVSADTTRSFVLSVLG